MDYSLSKRFDFYQNSSYKEGPDSALFKKKKNRNVHNNIFYVISHEKKS